MVLIPTKCHRQLSHLLDQLIHRDTFLLADDVPQNTAQQTNIVYQRLIFVVFTRCFAW